jgi:hypothetical protein
METWRRQAAAASRTESELLRRQLKTVSSKRNETSVRSDVVRVPRRRMR